MFFPLFVIDPRKAVATEKIPTRNFHDLLLRFVTICIHPPLTKRADRRNIKRKTKRKSQDIKAKNKSDLYQVALTPKTNPNESGQDYFPAPAALAAAGIIPAIAIPSMRASTISMLVPVSVQAST